METAQIARAVAAAEWVAGSAGLDVGDAVVLHNSNKLALRLTASDVMARVAPLGQEVAELEVEIAQQLAAVGAPAAALDPRVEPRVYVRDGFAVTLWTYYEPAAPQVAAADYAKSLERLHAGMREVEVQAPRFTDRVTEAEEIVADRERSPELGDADRAFLGDRLRDLRNAIEEQLGDEQLLHGEPHPGNLLGTKTGPRFIDWETCCRGPVEFDLAHVPAAVCEHYPGIDRGLLDDCRQLVLAMVAAWRWDIGDEFPDGRYFGEELIRLLRAGSPWPTLDEIAKSP
ncbi:phosphotransferase family protein [Kribbella sp. NPDC004536]|uniref:phosphotransferase family protein n=1 Tax=Kribbella sp. NPDC004536 TaxID=3364106 RepID=UPI00369B6A37